MLLGKSDFARTGEYEQSRLYQKSSKIAGFWLLASLALRFQGKTRRANALIYEYKTVAEQCISLKTRHKTEICIIFDWHLSGTNEKGGCEQQPPENGVPDRTRTCNRQNRNLKLYPIALRLRSYILYSVFEKFSSVGGNFDKII